MSYVINFFGTGIRYWICRIPDEEFQKIDRYRLKHNRCWEEVFFDLHTLEKFGYQDWESIHLLEEGKGWILEGKNWIEFKKGRKKRKVEVGEFLGSGLIFDSFNKERDDTVLIQKKGYVDVALVQLETGLILKYNLGEMNLDKICFKLCYAPLKNKVAVDWIDSITYAGMALVNYAEDSLTRESRVFVLNDSI